MSEEADDAGCIMKAFCFLRGSYDQYNKPSKNFLQGSYNCNMSLVIHSYEPCKRGMYKIITRLVIPIYEPRVILLYEARMIIYEPCVRGM